MKKVWGFLLVCFFVWIIVGKETIGGFLSDDVIYVLENENNERRTVTVGQSKQQKSKFIIGDRVRVKEHFLSDPSLERY